MFLSLKASSTRDNEEMVKRALRPIRAPKPEAAPDPRVRARAYSGTRGLMEGLRKLHAAPLRLPAALPPARSTK
jgi:hypothetical protein